MCNPHNEHPSVYNELGSKFYSAEIAENFPKFFLTMSFFWAVLAIIAVILVRRNPELTKDAVNTNKN